MRAVKYIYEIYTSDGEPRPIETTTLLAGIAVGHYIQLQDENSDFDASKTFRIEAVSLSFYIGASLTPSSRKYWFSASPQREISQNKIVYFRWSRRLAPDRCSAPTLSTLLALPD